MIQYYQICLPSYNHRARTQPCQDACHVIQRADGLTVAACADGLGSERHSDIGARIAAERSVAYCAAHWQPNADWERQKACMRAAFADADEAVRQQAADDGQPEDEYDTTLCLAVYDGAWVWYGQSGDSGLVVLLQDGRYLPVTEQQRDKEGCVFPLCFGEAYWQFGMVEQPVSSVMLMTDGVWDQICPVLLRRQAVQVHVPLAQKFMDHRMTGRQELDALQQAASAYLDGYPRRLLDDDKTVVVLFNPAQPASSREAAYYLPPDWEGLHRRAQQALYPEQTPLSQDGADVGQTDRAADPSQPPAQAACVGRMLRACRAMWLRWLRGLAGRLSGR